MFRFRSRARAASAVLALTCIAGLASASQFNVGTTRILLGADHPVETEVLTNQEARDVSFEVHVTRWKQLADGTWDLQPTDALLVHPLIVRMSASLQVWQRGQLFLSAQRTDSDLFRDTRVQLSLNIALNRDSFNVSAQRAETNDVTHDGYSIDARRSRPPGSGWGYAANLSRDDAFDTGYGMGCRSS